MERLLMKIITKKFTNIIREFNTHVKNDNRVEQIVLPIGDGLTVCRKL